MENDKLTNSRQSIFFGRPALTALIPYMAGILLSTVIEASYLIGLSLALASSILTIYDYSRGRAARAGVWALLTMLCLGWFGGRIASDAREPNHIQRLADTGGRVVVYGRVSDEPDIREERVFLVIDVDSVTIGQYRIPSLGRARAGINGGGSRYNYADYVVAEGYLYYPRGPRNPLGFDYGAYLRTKNIDAALSVKGPAHVSVISRRSTFLGSIVGPTREYLLTSARNHLSPVSAAILSGFILGERRDIPKEYQTMFKNTGTLHLMAVSGSNVGLVLAIFAVPLTLLRVPRKLRVAILLLVILFFAVLTRLEPSVVRASIMAAIGLLAYGWIRKPDYVNVLAFAALLMLLKNPMQLFDIGLQLSFAATFSIVYFLPWPISLISRMRWARFKLLRWLAALSITTIAAQAAVTPLMARYFNNVPIAGLAANIPVGILAGLATAGGIVFYFASFFGSWAAALAAYPLEIILDAVRVMLNAFSSYPGSNIKLASPSWASIFLYWIFIYIIFEAIRKRRVSSSGVILGLVAFSMMAWRGFLTEQPSWRLDYLDIGRNRAWFFVDAKGLYLGCVDIYDESRDPGQVIVPHIMNFLDGRVDYVFTSTPDSPVLRELEGTFSSELICTGEADGSPALGAVSDNSSKDYQFLGGKWGRANVVWGKSDNNKDEFYLPLLIETREGLIVFSTGDFESDFPGLEVEKPIALLEMPWSSYARQSCLKTITRLDPALIAFSPDRYSASLPFTRKDLTHSKNRVVATSICGGFSLTRIDGRAEIRTMRAFGD